MPRNSKRRREIAEPSIEPSLLKVADLKKELLKRGLTTAGNKPQLMARLEAVLIVAAVASSTKKPKAESASSAKKPKERSVSSAMKPKVDPTYSKMKVADIKNELISRGLDTSGKKAELINRLLSDADGGTLEEEPTEVVEAMDETNFSKAKRAVEAGASEEKIMHTKQRKVDPYYSGGMHVFEDWDCMLHQTNIGHNNNRFSVMQVLKDKEMDAYCLYTRWGRVGESGQNAVGAKCDLETVAKNFRKRFLDETKNRWEDREKFSPVPGKYTLIYMDEDSDDEPESG